VVSGERIWKFETAGAVLGRPAVTPNGVIFPSYDGFVYCVDAETGSEIDRFQTGEAVYSSPVVVGERAFFGNNGGKFYCLNLRGGESS
jgi:outer membrane protein assembly factor BamB